MDKLFRYLVLSSLFLYVVWFFFPYAEPFIADPDTVYFWGGSGFDARFEFPSWYYYLWLTFWLISYAALFSFVRSARTIFTVGYILSICTLPFHGTVIQSPWSGLLGSLVSMLDGAILALAYFTSIGRKFGRKAT